MSPIVCLGNVILTGIGRSKFRSGNHGTLDVKKDKNKDMGAALQSPSEVSPEAD